MGHSTVRFILALLVMLVIAVSGCVSQPGDQTPEQVSDYHENTKPNMTGRILIDIVGEFSFNPEDIISVRPDIFKPGYFSIFDILVHLDNEDSIDMEYRFDESMNTHVIDSINGMGNLWHTAFYDGGWTEQNVYRMDHYPYKDKMFINIHREDESRIQDIYNEYKEEIARKQVNGGKVIIPEVTITGPTTNLLFEDVEVTAHNLRNDTFQDGVITALDVILSLGDQGRLTYDLKWYESIGRAGIVKNYYVEQINDDRSFNRCGFVYEAGPEQYSGFRGNHIHVQTDIRTINSPEYVEFFWICL